MKNNFSSRNPAPRLMWYVVMFLLLRPLPAGAQEQNEPHLVFRKSVITKEYRGGQVYAEPYTVKQDEHLWQILRSRYRFSEKRIALYCKIAQEVNPDVRDIHRLYPNQHILVPYDYVKAADAAAPSSVPPARKPREPVRHVVKKDEYLVKILREIFGMSDRTIFSPRTLRLIAQANPGFGNLDVLHEGQTLIIPGQLVGAGNESTRRALSDAGEPAPVGPRLPAANTRKAPAASTRPELFLPDAEETRVKEMLSAFTRSFDGTDNSTGAYKVDLQSRGSLLLDSSRFPLYSFPWGRRVVLDYGGRLPDGVRDVIADEWENAEVVAVDKQDDIDAILDKVLSACGFFKVEKQGNYIVNHENIQINVSGNWIVFQDKLMKKVFAVNVVDRPGQTINPELKAYLADRGVQLVDIPTHGAAPAKDPQAPTRRGRFAKAQDDTIAFVDMILDAAGMAYESDYSTQIFHNISTGFSLEVVADRMFQKQGKTFLIDYQGLPGKIADIIAEQGFGLLSVRPGLDDLSEVARLVLDFAGIAYQDAPVQFEGAIGEKSVLKITVPGIIFSRDSGDVLLTRAALQKPLIDFLSEQGVTIIQY